MARTADELSAAKREYARRFREKQKDKPGWAEKQRASRLASYKKLADKRRAESREWYWKNRDKQLAYAKTRPKEVAVACALRRKYGMTIGEYEAMFTGQGGVCRICKRAPEKARLSVDHCHSTGRVRGLLCKNCNLILGNAKDSLAILQAAIEYLRG